MSDTFSWHCPFCNRPVTVVPQNRSISRHGFLNGNKHGSRAVFTEVIVCPNPDCREFALSACIVPVTYSSSKSQWVDGLPVGNWSLIPQASVKVFPPYVPASILSDYREACLIRELSPKASATLSRRCLQGMIRDFWGVVRKNLYQEIEAIEDKVDVETWQAIDAVRTIGNIGAHMETDINVIVEVDPNEAGVLIELIEILITEWYVARHERAQKMLKLRAMAAEKEALRNG
jgi:hypothetical protein